MGRPISLNKEKSHALMIMVPAEFWKELQSFYKYRKSYSCYSEMVRHLLRLGLDVVKKEETNGELNTQGG